jgi:CO/xanthine dehydrogenase FAD-binding subunit
MLIGRRITRELAASVGQASVAGARPLSGNGYKVDLTRSLVARTLEELASQV